MTKREGNRFLVAAAFLAGLVVMLAIPAAAQSPLEQVERLTRMGRTEEARAELSEWWEGDRSRASRRDLQRGLWLRGRLTVDPVQAELDFQRLAVLYPSGDFTADAILRLAQAAWAMGDEEAARRHLETLERDYPRSEALEQGRAWMADPGPLPAAEQRARQPSAVTPRTPAPTPPAEATERRATAQGGSYSVQLGAFAELERARTLYDSVGAEGVEARIVQVEGSNFTHVRVGSFAQRASAVELLDELTRMGISAALVRDERPERPIGND
ncbi:MAG: hypothetical protein HKN72_04195 [Gemmatimonadetes bacterium]|nr:hypothetical protein [Gemmatimonadota bacterium]